MKTDRQTKMLAIFAILLAVGGLSIGFAALSQELQIDGAAEVVGSSWDIHFENLQAPTIDGDAVVNTAPVISATTTYIGDFDISLVSPGDSVSYIFDVVNDGTFDARLDTMTVPTPTCIGTAVDGAQKTLDETNVCDNLSYTLTYQDDSAISNGDTLAANGGTRTMKLTLDYSDTVTGDILPSATVDISNLTITMTYIQD